MQVHSFSLYCRDFPIRFRKNGWIFFLHFCSDNGFIVVMGWSFQVKETQAHLNESNGIMDCMSS